MNDPPPSPGFAINHGVERSSGDALAIVIDGACILSPGALSLGLSAWRVFPTPVVVTRYFFLGPGDQVETTFTGYDQREEDRLLAEIAFPSDGYRLFECASPLTFAGPSERWLTGCFESNCLFLPRSAFDALGGCDLRFDLPGGGFLNTDLLIRACELPGAQPVQLLGEGVFHQVHGGITTNTPRATLDALVERYKAQYETLRGPMPTRMPKSFFFTGRLTRPACRWKMGD